MVGGHMQSTKVVASPKANGAPPCTYLQDIRWCKFPYCGFQKPNWPPFKPDQPALPQPTGPPPEVKLSCGVDHSKPCPVPTWTPTWDLARSTAIQPCNASGWYDPGYAAKWGLVSFDWSNAKKDWLAVSPPDCEERLVEQCKKIKTINPHVKCFVYRNTELSLEWLSSQRAVMDEAHAGYFLNFQVCMHVNTIRAPSPASPFSPPCSFSEAVGSLTVDCDPQGADAAAKCAAAGPCTYSSNGGPKNRPAYKYHLLSPRHQYGDRKCGLTEIYLLVYLLVT
jgi:hypothetical protein